MLTLTPDLKAHAVKNFGVAATADDATFRKAISDAVMEGKITPTQLHELTVVKQSESETKLQEMVSKAVSEAFSKGIAALSPQAAASLAAAPLPENAAPVVPATPPAESLGLKAYSLAGASVGADSPELVRVKPVVEQFSHNPTEATWDKSSNEVLAKTFGGRSITSNFTDLPYGGIDMPTDRSKAIVGAWFKNMVLKGLRKQGRKIEPWMELKEIDRQLLLHTVHTSKFIGDIPGTNVELEGEKLTSEMWRKAVLDDSTSGGLEAVPIEFDAAVILTPLLNGEVFPFVSITNVTRRRIEAMKMTNVTMGWGTGSGTAIPLFNTDSFISAFDNSIYPLTGAIELGLDFLADSPVAVGQIVSQLYGEKYRQIMDDVIVIGDGTTQPEGVFNASGISSIGSANGAGGPPTMGDYEALMFGVGKEFLQQAGMPPNSRAMFIGTQTSYKRARQVKVNSSSDERRLYGMDHMSYRLHDFRYAINGSSSFSNSKVGFFCMNRYRMYRRQGLEVVQVGDTDWNLVRQNKRGIALRSRWGGALELAAAGAKHTDMQS